MSISVPERRDPRAQHGTHAWQHDHTYVYLWNYSDSVCCWVKKKSEQQKIGASSILRFAWLPGETRRPASSWADVRSWELWQPSIFEWVGNRTKGYILSPFCFSEAWIWVQMEIKRKTQSEALRSTVRCLPGRQRDTGCCKGEAIALSQPSPESPTVTQASSSHQLRCYKNHRNLVIKHIISPSIPWSPSCTILQRQSRNEAFNLHISSKVIFHIIWMKFYSYQQMFEKQWRRKGGSTELQFPCFCWYGRSSRLWHSDRVSGYLHLLTSVLEIIANAISQESGKLLILERRTRVRKCLYIIFYAWITQNN